MNNFRKISEEYKSHIISQNPNIWGQTVKMHYFILDGDTVEYSTVPFVLDSAKRAMVIYTYTYTVVTSDDRSFFALFLDSTANNEADDNLVIDGWKLKFDLPYTSGYRTYGRTLYMSKENLSLEINDHWSDYLGTGFETYWKLFERVRECSTQKELNMLKELFRAKKDIDELKGNMLTEQYKNFVLEERCKAYESLLERVNSMLGEK
jgi:hypothetical protein